MGKPLSSLSLFTKNQAFQEKFEIGFLLLLLGRWVAAYNKVYTKKAKNTSHLVEASSLNFLFNILTTVIFYLFMVLNI